MATPLHNHSEYSQIDGVSKPSEIADRMIELGCPCCGLTDHGVVAGHLEFAKEMTKRGLKPIFGAELYHGVRFGEKLGNKRDQAHIIALAMTNQGLRNLWRLNDAAADGKYFHHVGRNSWEHFEKFHEGIVFTSACPAGLVAKGVLSGDYSDLNRYLDIMGDDFYIELTTYPGDAEFMDRDLGEPVRIADLNLAKYEIAQERGIPVVYGDDGHYAFEWQFEAHDAYVARSTGDSIYTPTDERKMYHPPQALCIKTEEEVREALSYMPQSAVDEAIANSDEIGARADAVLPDVRRHLPVFIPSESPWVEKGKYADDEADLLFLDLVEEGMYRCYGEDPAPEVIEQTQYEASVFLAPPGDDPDAVPLFHYFLMEWDMIQFCKDPRSIFETSVDRPIEVGPGRGSAAGCIVARELEITDVDPLPFNLYFERFWNPGRAKGFPDIDTDIEKGRRTEVKDYLTWRHGHERVRSIGNVTRMKPKSVVETMSKTCGITQQEEKELKKILDGMPDLDILGTDQIGWSEDVDPGKVLYVMHPSPDYPDNDTGDKIMKWLDSLPENRQEHIARFLGFCEILCNRVSNYGVHASGVVVADVDLADELPCRWARDQEIPVTQFPMDDVDKRQFVKLDLLGLRTLDVLSDWRKQMLERHGLDLNFSQLEWQFNDEQMWEMLDNGFAAGIFQVEKGYPKQLAKELRPRSVEDLSIIVALNRPGPIRSGAPDSFILRRNGGEDNKFDGRKIPLLKDILEPTYGWFLYQEQVIAYFRALGYDLGDADAVRKILGKKQPEKWDALYHGTEEWEGKSYIEMTKRAGIDKRTADEIWAILKDFARYSFNKAHSVAYGIIGYRNILAKYYGDVEKYVSLIRNVPKDKKAERMPQYIAEARRLGIRVYGVDIENSQAAVNIGKDLNIYFGFDDVKGMSTEGAHYLIELRNQGIDVSSPEAVADHIKALSKEWSKENARLKKEGLPKQEGKSPGQRLNAGHIEKLYTAGAWERLEGYPTPMREMQAREKEMLNVLLTDNATEAIANNIEVIEELEDTYEEANAPYPGTDVKYTLPGIVAEAREVTVKNGKNAGAKMGIVTIEWEGDAIEFAVFSDKWASYSYMWHERTPGIFTIRHSQNNKTGKTGYSLDSATKLS